MQKQTSLPANYRITKLSHNRKIELQFSEKYPLVKKVIRGPKIVNETVGYYEVAGTVTLFPNESKLSVERYDVSLDTIVYEGTNIKTPLEFHEDTVEIQEYFIRKYIGILEEENGTVTKATGKREELI